MSELLVFIGLVVLCAAFLSFPHPWMQRMGMLSVVVTTFAAGYLPTGRVWVGGAVVSLWVLVPWLEIFFRVRKFRLPLQKKLQPVFPPSREMFPELESLSDDIEASGFEHVADSGWEMDGYRQFLRLYARPSSAEEAAITCIEQNQTGFDFCSITSRTTEGEVYTTWNCPISQSLQKLPTVHLHRVKAGATFGEMLKAHQDFLQREGSNLAGLVPVDPEAVRNSVEQDMNKQVEHNLRIGLLRADEDNLGRYSWRGLFYLWGKVLRDILRIT